MEIYCIQLLNEKGMFFRTERKMHWFIYIFIFLQSKKVYFFNPFIPRIIFLISSKTPEKLKYVSKRYRNVK